MPAAARSFRVFRLYLTIVIILGQLLSLLPPPVQAAAPRPATAPAQFAAGGADPRTPELAFNDAALPLDVQYALSEELGFTDATYHVADAENGLDAANAEQGLRTRFDNLGMQISAEGYGWGIELAGFGRGDSVGSVPPGIQLPAEANRAEFDHGALRSWYVNGPLGVQQGWTVSERPAGSADQLLALALFQSGNLRAVLDDDRRGVQLVDANNIPRLTYGGLIAFDSAGNDLPVTLDLVDGCAVAPERCRSELPDTEVVVPPALRIQVDDRGAVYPITIDPWVQSDSEPKPGAESGNFAYGAQMVISSDGGTIAVSAPSANPAIYVFTRDAYGLIDTNATARLTFAGTGQHQRNRFGNALGMSADGSTIVWGTAAVDPMPTVDPAVADRAYVFVRPGAIWVDGHETTTLAPQEFPDSGGKRRFGHLDGPIAVSGDGSTIVVSSPQFNACAADGTCRTADRSGGSYVFVRPGATWPEAVVNQTTVLAGSSNNFRSAGGEVAISNDGGTIVFGSLYAEGVFRALRNGPTWSANWIYPGVTTGASRVVELTTGTLRFTAVNDVAVSGDGTLFASISQLTPDNRGAIDVWTNTATTMRFSMPAPEGYTMYGRSIGISNDGGVLIYPLMKADGSSDIEVIQRPEAGWPTTGTTAINIPPALRLSTNTSNPAVISGDASTIVIPKADGTLEVLLPTQTAPTPSPTFAVAGGETFTLTLQGSGFSANTRVRWNDANLPVTFISSSEISVSVAAERIVTPGTAQISVINPLPGGGAASFAYPIAYPEPVLTGIDPVSSYAGEPTLTLSATGSAFAPTSVIRWNGEPITTTFVNNTLLQAEVSAAQLAAVGEVNVTVTTPAPGGGTSAAITHTLVDAPTPTLTGISPFSRVAGRTGFTLTAVGSNFAQRSQIFWGDQALTTTYVNAATLTAEVSSDLIATEGPVNVTVRTGAPGGGSSAAQTFRVSSAAPDISSVFPFFGAPAGGTEVTISGINLENTETVLFGANPAAIVSATETTLTVTAPPGPAGSVDVSVTTPFGTATALGGFVYADSEPAQPWRDFGDVRVWADNFTTVDGVTTATGKVVIGNRPLNQRLYRVSEQVSWSSPTALTVSGTLGFFGGMSLSTGTYDLNTATGAITARAGAVPLISKLGNTNLAISPQLAINALNDAVQVQAALVLALPENPTLGLTVPFTLARDGSISAAGATPLTMNLAGGTLTASLTAAAAGLSATSSQLTLPGLAAIDLPGLRINDSGLQIGNGSPFSLPQINLNNGVLTLKNATATLTQVGSAYELPLSGTLALANLPETGNNRELTISGWKIAAGRVQGAIGNQDLTLGGAQLRLTAPSLNFAGNRYSLRANTAAWTLPAAWSGGSPNAPTATLSNVVIGGETPFITIDGGNSFTVPGSFTVGANTSRNRITFERVRGVVRLEGTRWAVDLTVNIRIQLGTQANDGGFYENVSMLISNNTLSGTIANARMNIGGLPLTSNLVYADGAFSAGAATLLMPKVWKSTPVNTGGVQVTPTVLRIGPAVGAPSFSVPNITIGIITFANTTARLEVDATDRYLLKIDSTVVITRLKTAGGVLPSAPLQATIKGGRIGGTLKNLEFSVSGFTMTATELQLVDGIIRSPEVKLQLPARLGNAATTLYRLEIGGASDFSVQGGAFKLPDFKIGTVGVKDTSASFLKEGDEYVIEAEGRMEFTKFAVEAALKIAYSSASGSAEVRRVMIAFEGEIPSPAIAMGSTGLYFTRISGEFSLEDGNLTISLGTRIATPGKLLDEHIFALDAEVTLQIKPSFEFRASAAASVVGMRVATAEVRIWGSGFSAKANAQVGIIRASLELTFGTDAWDEFTFYGEVRAAVVIPRGIVMDERILFVRVTIPPSDLRLAEARFDGGKFRDGNNRIWGARGSISILGGLYSIDAMVRFGGGGVSFGSKIWRYEPVRPRGLMLAGVSAAATANTPQRDTLIFNATNPGLTLTIVEVLTETQRLNPLDLQIRSPRNVPFTAAVAYTEPGNLYRIYEVKVNDPADMVGTWTVNPALGNEIRPLGLIPPPAITEATLCPVGGTCATPGSEIALAEGQEIDLSWSAESYTPGLTLEIYATDERGERSYITSAFTPEQALSDDLRWRPALAAGTYTITVELLGETGAPVRQDLATIVYTDAGAPAKPQGLVATAQHDLSVLLEWDADAAEADILGYQVAVNGGEPIQTDGQVSSMRSFGLAPGSTNTIAVAAYDLSGNVGEAAEVTVTMPSIGVSGSWPANGAIRRGTYSDIGGVFSGIVSGAAITVTDASGAPVLGATTVLTAEVLLESLDAGITPLAIDQEAEIAVVETGAAFVPEAAQLAPGVYTVTLSARDAKTQELITVSWTFEVLAPIPPVYTVHLPLIRTR